VLTPESRLAIQEDLFGLKGEVHLKSLFDGAGVVRDVRLMP
jgi:hypothetical protein